MATVTQRVVRRARSLDVDIRHHRQWNAQHTFTYQLRKLTKRHKLIPKQPADTIVQHISVTHFQPVFSDHMKKVEEIGWLKYRSGFSYNFGVDKLGRVGVGMPLNAAGTHTVNWKNQPNFSLNQNYVSVGIVFMAMPGDPLTPEAQTAITKLIAVLMKENVVTPDPDYMPHSFFAWKDCPTDAVRDAMPTIFKDAKDLAATL